MLRRLFTSFTTNSGTQTLLLIELEFMQPTTKCWKQTMIMTQPNCMEITSYVACSNSRPIMQQLLSIYNFSFHSLMSRSIPHLASLLHLLFNLITCAKVKLNQIHVQMLIFPRTYIEDFFRGRIW